MEVPPVWEVEAVRIRKKQRRDEFAMETQKMSKNGSEQSDFLGAFKNTRLLGQLLFVSIWFLLSSRQLS